VYECDASGATRLLKDLRPSRETAQLIEYTDLENDVPAQSARIYVFRRTTDSIRSHPDKAMRRSFDNPEVET
jgi:hypothetical protein